jgi:hypothetical protein
VKVHCHGKEFDEYSLTEAMRYKIPALFDWRKAEKNDWIVTWNNRVIQVFARFEFNKQNVKPSVILRTGYGDTSTASKHIYAKETKFFDDISKPYVHALPPTSKQKAYIERLINKNSFDEFGNANANDIISEYMAVFSDNNPKQALRRGLRILRKKSIKEMVNQSLKDKFESHGLDDDYVAVNLKTLVDDGETPDSVRLSALNRIGDVLGHTAKEKEEKAQNIIMISDGDKKLLAQVRQDLSDQQINQLMAKVKKDGVDAIVEDNDTEG